MKLKLICLLVMLMLGVSASPNRFCNGIRTVRVAPAATVADDSDLIPTKYFFNHI